MPPLLKTSIIRATGRQASAAKLMGTPPKSVTEKAKAVMNVLNRYRIGYENDWDVPDSILNSQSRIENFIKKGRSIELILPAFPFKSSNKSVKVLGTLPDEAERVSLMHLDGLCQAIEDVSESKAHIKIVSDGICYSDLLSVSDEDVWTYGEALRQMAKTLGCHHIHFARLHELLGPEFAIDQMTKDKYLECVSTYRRALHGLLPKRYDVANDIANNTDVNQTYKGYKKFLGTEIDFQNEGRAARDRQNASLAKQMLGRGKAFAIAIEKHFSEAVRLSIHPSSDTSKISIALLPQDNKVIMTPWHGALVRKVDGSISMAHANTIAGLDYELIYEYGRPSYFRERSPLFDWAGLDLKFEYLYPTGILIKANQLHVTYPMHMIYMGKVRLLAEKCSPIALRGFENTLDKRFYTAKAYELGDVQPWKSGVIQVVKDSDNKDPLNNSVVSNEAMPMHYDGMFKLIKVEDENGMEKEVSDTPRFQYFVSHEVAAPGDGYTLFASSALFARYLPKSYNIDKLSKIKWSCHSHGFFSHKLTDMPLVVPHPTLKTPCVRWHQPWPKWKTAFGYADITIDNGSQNLIQLVDSLLFDRRVCLRYTWKKGDLLVSDNFAMLHTRTAFKGSEARELWRIHTN